MTSSNKANYASDPLFGNLKKRIYKLKKAMELRVRAQNVIKVSRLNRLVWRDQVNLPFSLNKVTLIFKSNQNDSIV